MAEIMNLEGAPENCAHDCDACSAGCEMNPDGKQGKLWKAMEEFSKIEADDLLDALNSISSED